MRHSAVLFFALVFASLVYGGATVKYGIYAALLHELGHVVVYVLLYFKIPLVSFSLSGMSIKTKSHTRGKEAVLLLSGVFANFLLVAIFYIKSRFSPTYSGYFFMSANLFVGLLNLVPLPFTDGGRLLSLMTPTKYFEVLETLYMLVSVVFCAILLIILCLSSSFTLKISLAAVIMFILANIFKR